MEDFSNLHSSAQVFCQKQKSKKTKHSMEKYLFKGDESVVERTNHKPGVSMDHLNLFIFLFHIS